MDLRCSSPAFHLTSECVLLSHRSPTLLSCAVVSFCSYDSTSGGEREIQRTMLELLNQLDGFDARGDVKVCLIVMAVLGCSGSCLQPLILVSALCGMVYVVLFSLNTVCV